jgi:hypothetical protein
VEEIDGDKKSNLLGQNIAMKSFIVPAPGVNVVQHLFFFVTDDQA